MVVGPSYISSHSADVILSEIRPIKLKIEALRSINVLLDEFLYNILNTARSLSTDKLRAGLLSILNTSLGKEALLEAEVELRAYWDRSGRPDSPVEDDASTFHLQWAFEVRSGLAQPLFLRLKGNYSYYGSNARLILPLMNLTKTLRPKVVCTRE